MASRLLVNCVRLRLVQEASYRCDRPLSVCFARGLSSGDDRTPQLRQCQPYRQYTYARWPSSPLTVTHSLRQPPSHLPSRLFHSSPSLFDDGKSKVERTVEAAKAKKAKKESEPGASAIAEAKPSLWMRVRGVVSHYITGFRLLFLDTKISARLLVKVLRGKSLSRRERKQFLRTSADLFRIVPFSVFIIVPFMELLLPVAIYFFPNMLPSTFEEKKTRDKRARQQLSVKLSMAKFLQDAMEETAVQIKGKKGTALKEFAAFIEEVRASGQQAASKDILRFAPLFEDEMTLDNLSRPQLQGLCRMLLLPTVGPDPLLRFHLRMKMRRLESDDEMIAKEGIDSLTIKELQQACQSRGMRALGMPKDRLHYQLEQWIDLHLNKKLPTSLLLLSRTLYLPEHVPTEEVLVKTISALPEPVVDEVEVTVAEVEGEPVDNQKRLDVVKQQEELIKTEQLQLEKENIGPPKDEEIVAKEDEQFAEKPEEELKDSAPSLSKEREELQVLKEDFQEYCEDVKDLKVEVGEKVVEPKSSSRLGRKVDKLIKKLDEGLSDLEKKSESSESKENKEQPKTSP